MNIIVFGKTFLFPDGSDLKVEIKPASEDAYWEYDDGQGNPIYDKDTGEALRDPVTGQPV